MILASLILGAVAMLAVLASVYIEDRYQSKVNRGYMGVSRFAKSDVRTIMDGSSND